MILDNGNQSLLRPTFEHVYCPERNLGVAGSWNWAIRQAFVANKFDGLVLIQDDIKWGGQQLESARRLLQERKDVDLFLSHLQFSVQVLRPDAVLYDERFGTGWAEDDDYALELTKLGRVYQRFRVLDPGPESITSGTPKADHLGTQHQKLVQKWGANFPVNDESKPYYMTNKHFATW